MLSLCFRIRSGLLLLFCACLTTVAVASDVEYQFFGTNQQFAFVPLQDDNASFDLIVPSFITTATTTSSWNSCSYFTFVGPDTCTEITFTPGLLVGSTTYDALSLSTAGGNGFTDMLFDAGTFGMYGAFGGETSESPQWNGTLTISPVTAPEPASLLMLGSGLLFSLRWTRKRYRS